MSAAERGLAALLRSTGGGTLVGFALVLPGMLSLGFAIVDFSLVLLDFHRASEATRRGAREAAIVEPVASLASLPSGGVVTCSGGSEISCAGGAVVRAGSFQTILGEMQAIHPGIGPANVVLEYRWSGIGDPASPGGILPLVTVRLRGMEHRLTLMRAVPGIPGSISYPDFATAQIGAGVKS